MEHSIVNDNKLMYRSHLRLHSSGTKLDAAIGGCHGNSTKFKQLL